MSCTQTLELMLDAAPDELAGRGESALAIHLRECARCRAVADRILADTRALARAIESRAPRSVPRASRTRRTLIGGGALVTTLAAAALVFAVMKRSTSTGTASVARPAPIVVPRAAVAESTPPVAVARPAAAVDSALLGSIQPQQYAAALPVTPTQLTASPVHPPVHDPQDQSDITVTPSAGLRAAVMRTSNPNITVVWLY
jgi:hypothetical protein